MSNPMVEINYVIELPTISYGKDGGLQMNPIAQESGGKTHASRNTDITNIHVDEFAK